MQIKIYQVDAFADKVFSGNPAAVCPLTEWISDRLLQDIAMENNLAETAFYVKNGEQFEIRWFTPSVEVDLCGHATLAAAYVLFHFENYNYPVIHFNSPRSGYLTVSRKDDLLTLDFPVDKFHEIPVTDQINSCFNIKPAKAFLGKTDYMLLFRDENEIRDLIPDLNLIQKLNARGVIVTAKGNEVDFVSRFFAPQSGINEDPVTGSAHTTLAPYWAMQYGKHTMTALQLSRRRGYLVCSIQDDRVLISGTCKLYMTGEIHIHPDF